ncbi:MAG: ATP-binding protein [Bacteroidota bacterium]
MRETKVMYPEIAVRELVANALVHQDFYEKGSSPLIEIYSDRIEITNPGIPLISPERFIDEYQSRNEVLSSVLRRLGICEKKGSGMDKVVFNIELYQLPAYDVRVKEKHTVAILFAHKILSDMDKNERIRACYQHCCLRYVMNEKTTNQSVRERFKIVDSNYPIASKIIKETLQSDLIKEGEAKNQSNRSINYIPFWA